MVSLFLAKHYFGTLFSFCRYAGKPVGRSPTTHPNDYEISNKSTQNFGI